MTRVMQPVPPKLLAGHRVGISASLDDNAAANGLHEADLKRVLGSFSQTLLARGAKLVLGQDWRPDSVMNDILRIAQLYQPNAEPSQASPIIATCVAWPDEPYADSAELTRLAGIFSVEQIPAPKDSGALPAGEGRVELRKKEPNVTYLRSRALTQMRRHLNALCTARICLGGKRAGFSGRAPGIVEEAWMAVKDNKPLYLSTLLGGVTSDLISVITGSADANKPLFEPSAATVEGFEKHAKKKDGDDQLLASDLIRKDFAKLGLAGLSKNNGLTKSENESLFKAVTLAEAMNFVVEGLSRVRHKH